MNIIELKALTLQELCAAVQQSMAQEPPGNRADLQDLLVELGNRAGEIAALAQASEATEGYFVEWNGERYQSVFPAAEAELGQLHVTIADAVKYFSEVKPAVRPTVIARREAMLRSWSVTGRMPDGDMNTVRCAAESDHHAREQFVSARPGGEPVTVVPLRWYAISGRLHSVDEDSVEVICAASLEEAEHEFRAGIMAVNNLSAADVQEMERRFGRSICITSAVVSDTAIKEPHS